MCNLEYNAERTHPWYFEISNRNKSRTRITANADGAGNKRGLTFKSRDLIHYGCSSEKVGGIVISVVALILQRQSEARNLRISFLLPELSGVIDQLRSIKVQEVKDGKPDAKSMTDFYVKAKDICFQKEHILKSIGLGRHVDVIINAQNHTENDILEAYKALFLALDNRYQKLVGKDNKL